jgi:predicted ribosomally synthesized peptide with SipW-like signal peptide
MVKKMLASMAVLGAAASIAGLGTYATFTSSSSASNGVHAGSVSIALGAAGPTNRLTLGATGLLPGDTMQRVVDLKNDGVSGSDDLAAVTLTTAAAPSSLLDSDAANGLQMTIDRCSAPWTESGTSPAFTYSCAGTTSPALASRPVVGSNLSLSGLTSLAAGATDHLRVTLTLPTTAPNAMQGLSSTLTYTFTGTQRAGASK